MASKKRHPQRNTPSATPAVGYTDVTHADLALFVGWLRDRKKSASDVKKVLAKFELLKHHGIQWGRPHVRQIDGTLWELKVRGNNTHRIYFRHEPPHARCVWYGTKNEQESDISKAKGLK